MVSRIGDRASASVKKRSLKMLFGGRERHVYTMNVRTMTRLGLPTVSLDFVLLITF